MQLLKVEPNGTAKAFLLSSAIWFVVGTTLGGIDATHLAAPELIDNIPFLVFGRLRPMHTNTVIFGFVGTSLMGAGFYLIPVMTRTVLYSERLGKLALWVWNLSILSGNVLLGLGYSQSREYAEWIWPVDIGILTAFALIFVNYLMTTLRRQEKILYVSVWYLFAALVFTWCFYFFGNAVWNPRTGSLAGLADANLAWFYGHGIIGLFMTPLAVAVAYYIVPIVSRAPLYSHSLSLIGFWTILVLYSHIGAHHIIQTPIPTWLKVVAITGSLSMLLPVATVLVNLWLTMRGRLGVLHANIAGKFVFAGLVWYALVCIAGPLQALPSVQRVTHLNNWVIAHSHLGVLGFAGFIGLAGIWLIIPRIIGRPLYEKRLADIQYWLLIFGLTAFHLVLSTAGLIQGNSWLNGEAIYRTLPMMHIYMVLRLFSGLFIIGAAYIGLYNLLRTLYWPGKIKEGLP
ncbi:MAG: cytochrome-c oxidase [Desulfatitalea sp. BRH_c12]|nr:MAG: cytochrome-c oxidase [Desulfatitalea sp. BRH_c12]